MGLAVWQTIGDYRPYYRDLLSHELTKTAQTPWVLHRMPPSRTMMDGYRLGADPEVQSVAFSPDLAGVLWVREKGGDVTKVELSWGFGQERREIDRRRVGAYEGLALTATPDAAGVVRISGAFPQGCVSLAWSREYRGRAQRDAGCGGVGPCAFVDEVPWWDFADPQVAGCRQTDDAGNAELLWAVAAGETVFVQLIEWNPGYLGQARKSDVVQVTVGTIDTPLVDRNIDLLYTFPNR